MPGINIHIEEEDIAPLLTFLHNKLTDLGAIVIQEQYEAVRRMYQDIYLQANKGNAKVIAVVEGGEKIVLFLCDDCFKGGESLTKAQHGDRNCDLCGKLVRWRKGGYNFVWGTRHISEEKGTHTVTIGYNYNVG